MGTLMVRRGEFTAALLLCAAVWGLLLITRESWTSSAGDFLVARTGVEQKKLTEEERQWAKALPKIAPKTKTVEHGHRASILKQAIAGAKAAAEKKTNQLKQFKANLHLSRRFRKQLEGTKQDAAKSSPARIRSPKILIPSNSRDRAHTGTHTELPKRDRVLNKTLHSSPARNRRQAAGMVTPAAHRNLTQEAERAVVAILRLEHASARKKGQPGSWLAKEVVPVTAILLSLLPSIFPCSLPPSLSFLLELAR
jgi:thiol:disulfide interchange protein